MFNNIHISSKVIAAALFGVVIFAFAAWKSPSLKIQQPNSSLVEQDQIQTNTMESKEYLKDSDGDGIKDWEEILLGLNPNNKDSDGDGVLDYDEVVAAKKTFSESKKNISSNFNASTTQTDLLAREIFGAYVKSKQKGTYNKQSFDFLIAKATNSQFGVRNSLTYTIDDILTTKDISNSRTLQYKKDFQDAISQITEIKEYELTTYGRAVQTGDSDEFAKLVSAANVYQKIAEALILIMVPEDASKEHLDLVNSFSTFSKILKVMGSSPDDPLLTFVATRDFVEGEDSIKTAYTQLNIYFTLKELDT